MTLQKQNHKFNKNILSLIRLNKQKYLRKSLSLKKKKIIFFSGITFSKNAQNFVLKKDRFKFYKIVPFIPYSNKNLLPLSNDKVKGQKTGEVPPHYEIMAGHLAHNDNISQKFEANNQNLHKDIIDSKIEIVIAPKSNLSFSSVKKNIFSNMGAVTSNFLESAPIWKKNKYQLNSYLFKLICKLPRKYISNFLGKEILRKYSTIPLKLSITRFILNKILKGYYQNLSHKALSNLCHHKDLCKTQNKNLQKKEIAKNLVLKIEKRLDTSLLRLLNFKSFYTIKKIAPSLRYNFIKKYPKYIIKAPLSNYTSLQIKQLINHGHIFVNNKKVKSRNFHLKMTDKVKISGFIRNLRCNSSQDSISSFLKKDHQNTLLLRKLKNKDYLNFRGSLNNSENSLHLITEITEASEITLKNLIKTLKIKRFTEIFYVTYKNLHLIDRLYKESNVSNNNGLTNILNLSLQQNHIEKNIKPLFDFIGYNQSIFLLWPVMSMLKITSWEPNVKQNILKFPLITENTQEAKQKLQNLIRYKRFLMKNLKEPKVSNKANSINDQNLDQTGLNSLNLSKQKNLSIPNQMIQLSLALNLDQLFRVRSSKCYASILYGTRVCKWIRFQQGIKRDFHNKLYNKINFFEWELEFFQYIIRYYK